MPFDGQREVGKRYGTFLMLLLGGAAIALLVFVLLPHGQQKYDWEVPDWLSPWHEIMGWIGIAVAIYAFLKLRLILLAPHRGDKRR